MNISIFLISTITCYYPSHFNLQEMFPFDYDDPCAFDIKSEVFFYLILNKGFMFSQYHHFN
jgi:hypothetical protein